MTTRSHPAAGSYALKTVIRANADGTIETPPSLTFEPHGRADVAGNGSVRVARSGR